MGLADPPSTVAETDDVLSITITNLDGQTFETTHVLTTAEVEASKIGSLDVTTNLLATENQLFVVEGTVFLEDGETPARSGLKILVDLNGEPSETATDVAAGYQVTFVDLLGTSG